MLSDELDELSTEELLSMADAQECEAVDRRQQE